jgi:pimeloyl-ACP methyl ester carboxylesterase
MTADDTSASEASVSEASQEADMSDDLRRIPTKVGALGVRIIGSGPAALLWHSLFVDSTSWDRAGVSLAHHRTIILVDGPCHGSSESWPRRFSLRDCADAASQVLDELDLGGPVDWVGNAWGGHVGIVFAESQRDRIKSLVTIGTPVQALTRAERRSIVPLVALYRSLGPVKPLVKGVEKALLGAGCPPDDTRFISEPLRAAARKGMHNAMHSVMLGRPDLLHLLPKIDVPTRFVAVKDDPLAPVENAEAAARLLPHGSTSVIPGRGHVAPLLQSAPELAETIVNFWQSAELPAK